MKISILPKSRFGRWTVGLNIFFLLSTIFFYIFAELLRIIQSDILITIFGFTSIIASLSALFTGVVAVKKNKERSVMVFMAILTGFVVLVFIICSIIIPDV